MPDRCVIPNAQNAKYPQAQSLPASFNLRSASLNSLSASLSAALPRRYPSSSNPHHSLCFRFPSSCNRSISSFFLRRSPARRNLELLHQHGPQAAMAISEARWLDSRYTGRGDGTGDIPFCASFVELVLALELQHAAVHGEFLRPARPHHAECPALSADCKSCAHISSLSCMILPSLIPRRSPMATRSPRPAPRM